MDLNKNLQEFMRNKPEPHEDTEEDFKEFIRRIVEVGGVMVAPPDTPGLDYLKSLGLPVIAPEDYDGDLEMFDDLDASDDLESYEVDESDESDESEEDDDDWIPF